MKLTSQSKHHMQKFSPLTGLGLNIGMSAAVLSIIGGMNKMAGLFGDETPQKLAKEMMAGAVEGLLEHFEYKFDEQKRQIENLREEIKNLAVERDTFKEELHKELLKKKKK